MNVTQCEGQLSTYHLNGGSMTTPQSEGKKKKKKRKKKRKKKEKKKKKRKEDLATKEEGFIKMWLRKKKDFLRCGYERRRIY